MKNIPVCTTVIVNSLVRYEPSVTNGASNSNEWKLLTKEGATQQVEKNNLL